MKSSILSSHKIIHSTLDYVVFEVFRRRERELVGDRHRGSGVSLTWQRARLASCRQDGLSRGSERAMWLEVGRAPLPELPKEADFIPIR